MQLRGGRREVVNTQQHCFSGFMGGDQGSWSALYRLLPLAFFYCGQNKGAVKCMASCDLGQGFWSGGVHSSSSLGFKVQIQSLID